MPTRILFVNGYAFLPQVVGGIEVSTLDLCLSLQTHGHKPAVLCSLVPGNALWLWNRIKGKLLRQAFHVDRRFGMKIYRGWSTLKGLPEVAQREQPHAVIVQGGLYNSYEIAAASVRLGLKTFYYVHDVGVITSKQALPDMTGVKWIANSAFTARTLKRYLSAPSEIIPPLFRSDNYHVPRPGRRVTLVNPRPEKGGEIALEVARLCPEIPFQFVEAWSHGHPDVIRLKAQATSLPNVKWLPVQTDMRSVYADTRILLMPSQCEETWGRVITEAQFSGIPAIVSRIGALPETLGAGGISLASDAAPKIWAEALQTVFHDDSAYQRLSAEAHSHSQRDDLIPGKVAEKFAAFLQAD